MATKKTVVVLDPYHAEAIALLQSTPNLDVVLPDDPRRANWHEIADGVLVRSMSRIKEADLKAATRLRAIVKQGVGVDNIDLEAAKAAGIPVHNTPALNSEAVAELTLAMGLSLARRMPELDRRLLRGERIDRTKTLALSLFQKTIGIIGMGNIGIETARKWIGACSAKVIGYDPHVREDIWPGIPHTRVHSLDELLRASDVVTLHVPLLPTTRGMIGERELGLMKQDAILINAARGGLVDEAALLQTLKQKKLWGVALDATQTEPPTLEVYRELLSFDNLLMTPHVGGSTADNQTKSGKAAAQALIDLMDGKEDVSGKLV